MEPPLPVNTVPLCQHLPPAVCCTHTKLCSLLRSKKWQNHVAKSYSTQKLSSDMNKTGTYEQQQRVTAHGGIRHGHGYTSSLDSPRGAWQQGRFAEQTLLLVQSNGTPVFHAASDTCPKPRSPSQEPQYSIVPFKCGFSS